jgi:Leg1
MGHVVPHPPELAESDLFDVWTTAEDIRDQFDPFDFRHRMAAYRTLIDVTNHSGLFGPDNRHNPLWGLMFQHQWQFRTARLGATSIQTGRIDPDAAWGYGNYALSVLPWLGAMSAGLVPAIEIAAPRTPARFDYVAEGGRVPAEFRRGVEDWRAYFALVATDRERDLEAVQLALWKAHKSCLDAVAERIATIDPAPYSRLELTFLRGWCRMVDYLWAAAWPTDFDFITANGLDVLPERLLHRAEDLAELPAKVRRNVRNVIGLATMPAWRYHLRLRLWKRAMRTREARRQVVPVLDAVFNPRPANAAERRKLIRFLLRG